jgi:hypothetical protein
MTDLSTVVGLSETFDNFMMKDFSNISLKEIRQKCSFLVPTPNPTVFVGVTFIEDVGIKLLEVSLVEDTFGGKRRTPISNFATSFDVLTVYATVGTITTQFTQQLLNWGEYKKAVAELLGTTEV